MSSGEQQFGVFVCGVVDVDAVAVSYLAGFPENPDLVGIGTGQQATMANSWEVVSDILNEGACLLFYSRPDGLVSGGALSLSSSRMRILTVVWNGPINPTGSKIDATKERSARRVKQVGRAAENRRKNSSSARCQRAPRQKPSDLTW